MKPAFNSSKDSTITFDAPNPVGFVASDDCWTAGASTVTVKGWEKPVTTVAISATPERSARAKNHNLKGILVQICLPSVLIVFITVSGRLRWHLLIRSADAFGGAGGKGT